MKKSVNVLGTEYKIEYRTYKEFPALENMDGYTDTSIHLIVVDDMTMGEGAVDSKLDLAAYRRTVLRHEIIHAFLHESGLASNSMSCDCWAMNEEMVDWIAIQFPKILKAFEEVECVR